MLGSTPPAAMVTVPSSLDSSSSLRMASWMWRGTMLWGAGRASASGGGSARGGEGALQTTHRVFLLSRLALPASSSTSAVRYSSTAARYTGAPAPTRAAYLPCFR